jgi:hypothetical protein
LALFSELMQVVDHQQRLDALESIDQVDQPIFVADRLPDSTACKTATDRIDDVAHGLAGSHDVIHDAASRASGQRTQQRRLPDSRHAQDEHQGHALEGVFEARELRVASHQRGGRD